jgi:hypothetical protein
LIAVLTSFNPSERYGIDTINAISSRVWHTLTPPARGPDPGKPIVAAARDQTARASAAEAMQARHPSS